MKKYLAELVGTFVLTFLGCGAAVSLNCGADTASVIGTAVAFGLTVVAMAYAIGGISGCHINPAITLGVLLSGRLRLHRRPGHRRHSRRCRPLSVRNHLSGSGRGYHHRRQRLRCRPVERFHR